jgi:hypothetical protein
VTVVLGHNTLGYTFGGFAGVGWNGVGGNADGDFLFRLADGSGQSPAVFRPTGTDTRFQNCDPGWWPRWGSGSDLSFGHSAASGSEIGSHGFCKQGNTYSGEPNEACGGHGDWGTTDMEVWFLKGSVSLNE